MRETVVNHPLRIWAFSDGKPGHHHQVEGLVAALQRRRPCRVQWVALNRSFLGNRLLRMELEQQANGDQPDLLIGAGHTTHLQMLLLRRRLGGRVVVLMRPSLPLRWFDLVVVPRHDGVGEGEGVIETLGVLNTITPATTTPDSVRGVLLIGGASTHYRWSDEAVIAQLRVILESDEEICWQLTTSRRTPESFLTALKGEGWSPSRLQVVPHEQSSPGWLPQQLRQAAQVWVTPDSVSMVYEALSAGARVRLFDLPGGKRGRIAAGLDELERRGYIVRFHRWVDRRVLEEIPPPEAPLQEADRVAAEIERRWFDSRPTVVQMLPALESGGVERGTLEIGRCLVAAGFRSVVISAGGRLVPQLLQEGSEHIAWGVGEKSLSTLRYIGRVRRLLRELRPDVLHLRSRLPAWIGYWAWRGLAAEERPVLVTTVHGPYSVGRYSAVMVKGERVIAVSEMIRGYIEQNYPEVDPNRIQVIHRGVDPDRYRYGYTPPEEWLQPWRAALPQLQGKAVLTLPARLTRWKGQEDFIELIRQLVAAGLAVHGLIVGGAHPRKREYEHSLDQTITALGLEGAITLLGHRSDLREILGVSTLVYSLSHAPEAFGRTTIEALSLGVPVIGYDHGGVAEQLQQVYPEGRITPRSIPELVARTRAWLQQGIPKVREGHPFTLERMCGETMAVYRDGMMTHSVSTKP